MESREQIIQSYIDGYNELDLNKMLSNLDEDIIFRHSENGAITMELKGIDAFRKQAEEALLYFSMREQRVMTLSHRGNQSELQIEYYAVAAKDLPNGLKQGQSITAKGKSIMAFTDDNKIAMIHDFA